MQRKNMYIAVAVAIVVVALFMFLGLFGIGNTQNAAPEASGSPASSAQALLDEISRTGTVTQLSVIDTVVGTGTEAKAGDTITVNYTGVLPDGTMFDSSQGRGPFTFTLGVGQVIRGWDQGVQGMKVGGTRLLAIPSDLAYGERAIGKIPANSSLIFQVELVSVGAPTAPQQ